MEACRQAFLQGLLLGVLCACAAAKTLILCGGYVSDSNTEIWNKAVALAGGRGVARIGILTSASSQPITQGREYKALFESYNVLEAYWIPIHENNMAASMDGEVVRKIRTMTGFFFGGGKQQTYIKTLLRKGRQATLAFSALRDMYNNGTLVMATSAGAMVMPSGYTMVEGTSYGSLLYGAQQVGEGIQIGDLIYDPEGGLGFIGGHIIDSHFHERGRHGRLIRLLADTMSLERGTKFGLGIDEETGILLTDVGTRHEKGEVLGRAGVFYVDLTEAYLDSSSHYFRIINILAHYANPGDIIDTVLHKVTFNSHKHTMKGNETGDFALMSKSIFAQVPTSYKSEFLKVTDSLFNSRFDSLTFGATLEQTPQFYVIMTEDSETHNVAEHEGHLVRISYTNLKLEIRPFSDEK